MSQDPSCSNLCHKKLQMFSYFPCLMVHRQVIGKKKTPNFASKHKLRYRHNLCVQAVTSNRHLSLLMSAR